MSDNQSKPQSHVEKLQAQKEAADAKQALIEHNLKVYSKALNAIASTPNGEIVLKGMVEALGVFTVKSGCDGVALIEVNTKRNFYLQFIRAHLEPQFRHIIEG